jgi:hypothetical protein
MKYVNNEIKYFGISFLVLFLFGLSVFFFPIIPMAIWVIIISIGLLITILRMRYLTLKATKRK